MWWHSPFWTVDNLYAPFCGIFHLNSAAVARYGAFIQAKSPTNCDVHLAPSSKIVTDKQLK